MAPVFLTSTSLGMSCSALTWPFAIWGFPKMGAPHKVDALFDGKSIHMDDEWGVSLFGISHWEKHNDTHTHKTRPAMDNSPLMLTALAPFRWGPCHRSATALLSIGCSTCRQTFGGGGYCTRLFFEDGQSPAAKRILLTKQFGDRMVGSSSTVPC